MAKAIYKNKEDLKNAKGELPDLKFRRMKNEKVSVDLKNKRKNKKK